MNITKVEELIGEIQAKIPLEVIRQQFKDKKLSSADLFTKISQFEEFSLIYIEVSAHSKWLISQRTHLEPDDVLQEFVMRGLAKVIIFAEISKNVFKAYFNKSLSNFCIDMGKNEPGIGSIDPVLEEQRKKPPEPLIFRQNPGDKIELMESLQKINSLLDKCKSGEHKKLIFQIMDILGKTLNLDSYALLKYSKGRTLTLENVADLIEQIYTKYFGTKTNFMRTTKQYMSKKGILGEIFLEDIDIDDKEDLQKIREKTKDIKKALKSYRQEIIDSIYI